MIDYTTYSILSNTNVSSSRLYNLLLDKKIADDIASEIASAYTVYGKLTGIGNLLPFAQAVHETGWFTSRRWVDNYNPAGIGATNDGAEGGIWKSPSEGIFAQYTHLLAYTLPENSPDVIKRTLSQLSPRYAVLKRVGMIGIAKCWVDLNGRWAFPGKTYAQKISQIANVLTKTS